MHKSLLCLIILLSACSAPVQPAGKPEESKAVASASLFTPSRKLKLKAAVVRNSGDLAPVARSEFRVTPYSFTLIREQVQAKNNPGPEPKYGDEKYKTDCSYSICLTDIKKLTADQEAWRKKADVGLDEAIAAAKKASNRQTVTVKTDLSGEASLELPEGTWYISGKYSINSGKSNVYWSDVELVVKADTDSFELSNDNADVFNN